MGISSVFFEEGEVGFNGHFEIPTYQCGRIKKRGMVVATPLVPANRGLAAAPSAGRGSCSQGTPLAHDAERLGRELHLVSLPRQENPRAVGAHEHDTGHREGRLPLDVCDHVRADLIAGGVTVTDLDAHLVAGLQ